MSPYLRTTVTISGLVVCLALAAAWGWNQVNKPLPGVAPDDTAAICTETAIQAGQEITPAQITVSVLNASKRQGLAGRTVAEFMAQGFNGGESANAISTVQVTTPEIWTDDPDSAAVALVASWVDGVTVVQTSVSQVGVVVVVGDQFRSLRPGLASVIATTDTTICSPAP
jgi:hypothetical protein